MMSDVKVVTVFRPVGDIISDWLFLDKADCPMVRCQDPYSPYHNKRMEPIEVKVLEIDGEYYELTPAVVR